MQGFQVHPKLNSSEETIFGQLKLDLEDFFFQKGIKLDGEGNGVNWDENH